MVSRFEQFTMGISSIYSYIHRIERIEMERYGLKGAYARYLLVIARFPDGITAANLSELCERDKAAVSRAVSEMESQGLICRSMNHENAYRAKLALTQEGRKAADYVSKRAAAAVEQAGKGLVEEDRQILYATLALIAGNLQNICREGIAESSVNRSTEQKF